MKRSTINDIIKQADEFIRSFGHHLPPFAYLKPSDLLKRKDEMQTIFQSGLGWDVTDYGAGKFDELGLFLFTTRNGSMADLKNGTGMCYAEKIMISRQDQISPSHRHLLKTEDIINRGGGTLAIEMFESDANGNIDYTADVPVMCDGIGKVFKAGNILKLAPGESVTLAPGNWHKFWAEGRDVLIGEVSTVNDDVTDNVFAEPLGRFSSIEEDEEPIHLLVSDYAAWKLL
jgi:D-lyxose ketol-isomerase